MAYAKAAASLAHAKSNNATQQYSAEETAALVELLTSLGCPDPTPVTSSGTLPRRRETLAPSYEKLPSSVI